MEHFSLEGKLSAVHIPRSLKIERLQLKCDTFANPSLGNLVSAADHIYGFTKNSDEFDSLLYNFPIICSSSRSLHEWKHGGNGSTFSKVEIITHSNGVKIGIFHKFAPPIVAATATAAAAATVVAAAAVTAK